jgi:hypothetical protein
MGLMEARKPVKSAEPVVNRDELAMRLNRMQQTLAHITHGFKFSNEWAQGVVVAAKKMAQDARDQAIHDGETPTVTPKDMAAEIVGTALRNKLPDGVVIDEIRYLTAEYQKHKATDPEDPMDYIEHSDFLSFMQAQIKVAKTFTGIDASRPASFLPFVNEMENCLHVYAMDSQDEELRWSSELQEALTKLVPFLIFVLRSI